MSTENGGSAFPEVSTHVDYHDGSDFRFANVYSYGGMSLHQWYAGLAMQGLLAAGEYSAATAGWVAQEADAIATAMLTQVGDKS
ncbi:hypothetical protein [Luteibacter sp. SG786]|uniref:hypothetical protein n=1 Tax=Luteibacter sp. SG786 TaxID=2587130 RepID=UPI00141DB708|nr:hypothetical protein [Luteibacter sp. SG786]NII54369.1 hypothetical protein [Luteibacter sp. SG786]